MGKPLDYRRYGLRRARIIGGDTVANIEYVFPVLAGEVLVGGLDNCASMLAIDISIAITSLPKASR